MSSRSRACPHFPTIFRLSFHAVPAVFVCSCAAVLHVMVAPGYVASCQGLAKPCHTCATPGRCASRNAFWVDCRLQDRRPSGLGFQAQAERRPCVIQALQAHFGPGQPSKCFCIPRSHVQAASISTRMLPDAFDPSHSSDKPFAGTTDTTTLRQRFSGRILASIVSLRLRVVVVESGGPVCQAMLLKAP